MVQNEVDAVLAKLGLRSQDIKEFVYLTLQDALTAGDIQFASLDASTPNTPTFQLNLRQTVTDRLFKPGGSVGQIPKKNTTSNYDWDWANDATSGSTPPPVTTATFYLAVVTTTTPTASDFTSGTSMTGSLPISFTITGGSFTDATRPCFWVPDTHPITQIQEGSLALNQISAFTVSALTINSVAGKRYVMKSPPFADSESTTWRLIA